VSASSGGVQRGPLLGVACVDVSTAVEQQPQQLIQVINATLTYASISHQRYQQRLMQQLNNRYFATNNL